MPIYEYQCQVCGSRTEVVQRFADPPKTVCEACGGALKKLISAPAFQFKGSGWYLTDYARKSGGDAKDGAGKDAGAAKDGGADKAASTGSTDSTDSGGGGKKESTPAASSSESSKPAKPASS